MDDKRRGWSLLVAVGALGWAAVARAQDLSGYFPQGVPGYDTAPGVTVQSRARPPYDQAGVRAGSFQVYPQVDLGFGYDSNLFGTAPIPGSRLGSWVFNTGASVRASSDWGRHSLGASSASITPTSWTCHAKAAPTGQARSAGRSMSARTD